jgi:hypothetical protein
MFKLSRILATPHHLQFGPGLSHHYLSPGWSSSPMEYFQSQSKAEQMMHYLKLSMDARYTHSKTSVCKGPTWHGWHHSLFILCPPYCLLHSSYTSLLTAPWHIPAFRMWLKCTLCWNTLHTGVLSSFFFKSHMKLTQSAHLWPIPLPSSAFFPHGIHHLLT